MEVVKPGEWYDCAICATCQQPIPVFHVMKDAFRGGDDSVEWEIPCQKCGSKHRYKLQSLQRLQAREMGLLTGRKVH